MESNVYAEQDIIKLKESVEHVTLILITMEEIVFVIMDTMVMLINVKSVTKLVENVMVPKQVNVKLALM